MNPGYLSLILIGISLVLLATGWKQAMLGDVSQRVVLTFFSMWAVGSTLTLPFDGLRVNGVYPLLLVTASFGVVAQKSPWEKANTLLLGLWYGPFAYMLGELMLKSPVLVIHSPQTDVPLAIALMAAFLQKSPVAQIASLSIGLMMADVFNAYAHRAWLEMSLGSAAFRDGWWLAIVCSCTAGSLIHGTVRSVRGAVHSWNERRRNGWGGH